MIYISLVIALLAGWYAKDMYVKVTTIYEHLKDRATAPAGIVKPQGIKATRSQLPTDDDTGVVRRQTQEQIDLRNLANKSLIANEKHKV